MKMNAKQKRDFKKRLKIVFLDNVIAQFMWAVLGIIAMMWIWEGIPYGL